MQRNGRCKRLDECLLYLYKYCTARCLALDLARPVKQQPPFIVCAFQVRAIKGGDEPVNSRHALHCSTLAPTRLHSVHAVRVHGPTPCSEASYARSSSHQPGSVRGKALVRCLPAHVRMVSRFTSGVKSWPILSRIQPAQASVRDAHTSRAGRRPMFPTTWYCTVTSMTGWSSTLCTCRVNCALASSSAKARKNRVTTHWLTVQ